MASTPDYVNSYRLSVVIGGVGRGFSEVYFIRASSWDEAKAKGKLIAMWRAAILGRGMILQYASIARLGGKKPAKVVIPNPLSGSMGVSFLATDWSSERSLNVNTPASGLRIRLETAAGENATRLIKAIPDGAINAFKYLGTSGNDVVNLGTTEVDFGVGTLPITDLWPYAGTPPVNAADFYPWETAFTNFAQAVREHSVYFRKVPVEGSPLPSLEAVAWESTIYRGVSDRRTGRPLYR